MNYRMRRLVILLIIAAISLGGAAYSWLSDMSRWPQSAPQVAGAHSAQGVLATLPTKGRAPKTDYRRSQFGPGWQTDGICDTRNRILQRDLRRAAVNNQCKVTIHIPARHTYSAVALALVIKSKSTTLWR